MFISVYDIWIIIGWFINCRGDLINIHILRLKVVIKLVVGEK